MNKTTKETIEDMLTTVANIAYTDYHDLSLAIHKIVVTLVLEDNDGLKQILDAIKDVELKNK